MVDRADERLGVYGSSLVDTSGYHSLAKGHFKTIGNPNRQGGNFSTRSLAHKQLTINPLLPR